MSVEALDFSYCCFNKKRLEAFRSTKQNIGQQGVGLVPLRFYQTVRYCPLAQYRHMFICEIKGILPVLCICDRR